MDLIIPGTICALAFIGMAAGLTAVDAYLAGSIRGGNYEFLPYANDHLSKWRAYWYDKGYKAGRREADYDRSEARQELIKKNKEHYDKRG